MLVNSAVQTQLNLVHAESVNFVTSGDLAIDVGVGALELHLDGVEDGDELALAVEVEAHDGALGYREALHARAVILYGSAAAETCSLDAAIKEGRR